MVGNYFTLFGGFIDGKSGFRKEIVNRNGYIWSIKKQKWIQGFQFDNEYGGKMCGVSINDTIGVFFGQQQMEPHLPPDTDLDLDYLAKFVIDVKSGIWIEKNKYFHDLRNLSYYDLFFDLACTSIFSKSLEL